MIASILKILAGIDFLIWGILLLIQGIKTLDEFKGYNGHYGMTFAKICIPLQFLLISYLLFDSAF